MSDQKNKKVTGIGGIFFKCQDPKGLKTWYNEHLGLNTDQYGALFEFRDADEPERKSYLQWSTMSADTEYFQPSDKQFMINYRVGDLDYVLAELKKAGIEPVDKVESYDYGRFVHLMDPEGNKIELWEPVDQVFTDEYGDKTTK